ncbi:hypothetical protein SAMN06265375_101563 [Muriicola jejuensis]|uniref:Uncharacterized protein n=1 Tax=Muriicola jejuensis TaxID=504488 RepID=A0A6P0U9K4_9FLAO|nr:hypothetical protein [Muriicola jejuensis]NER09915.1 hypothetical protein [Muriicola jejuensis]SMP04783.1 hypothetical protein SAMN06265375_101563 [Muriicola jejuensis]
MSKEIQPKKMEPSDEIDLGQLFALIGKGFNRLFRGFLSIFLYLKKNLIILSILIVVGTLGGFGLKLLTGEEQKLDVIVTPNIETKNYLYDVVAEIQSDIRSKDTVFFSELGMEIARMKGFEIEISQVKVQGSSSKEDEMKFIELLKDFENSEAISDLVRSELEEKTTKDHRITFYFKDSSIGEEYARKILDYINSNSYYQSLLKVYTENAQNRIQRNDSLISQIDLLISNYTQKMLREQASSEGRLVLENQESLDIPSLLNLKNRLIQETESKKLELEKRKDAITVVNFGKPHKVQKPLFQKKIAWVPLSFIGIFFLFSFVRYLNQKAKEMQLE